MKYNYIFNNKLWGGVAKKVVLKIEGGEQKSITLRKYFSETYDCDIGLYSYGCFTNNFCVGGHVEVGRYCSIAGNVHCFRANHPTKYISSSAYFYNKSLGLNVQDVERAPLTIGNDVWIGYGCVITMGCREIGNGAVIGAGSVVTHDVPAYSIVAGNPARHIRYRFDSNIVEELERIKWWEKEPEELYLLYNYMKNPEEFIFYYKEKFGL